jgi:hypothetical protein
VQNRVSVQATQARLTPGDIAKAREELAEFDFFDDSHALTAGEPEAVIDEETQALLNRAQALLEGGSLTEEQKTLLLELMEDIDEAETQDELDDLAEGLLDALFDLE